MESSQETTTQHLDVPLSVEGQIALDLDLLVQRVHQMVQGRTGQREWALAKTRLQEAEHWVREARGEFFRPPHPEAA